MSYVGDPFVHDIFVSYSHGDEDGDGDSPLKRWSQAFARELESELRQYPGFGRDLSVFLDQGPRPAQALDPLSPLTQALRESVALSALVTVLTSPHYLQSKWCEDERDWWQAAQGKHRLSREGRIAVARVWPVPQEAKWPPLLADERGHPLLGFCFYDQKRADARPQPYEWPAPDPTSKGAFREVLLELTGALRRQLDAVKGHLAERRRVMEDAQKLEGDNQVLYLHARADQAKAWEAAGDALGKSGFVVLPSDPEPVERDPAKLQRLRTARVETLNGCDALVLLGSEDGRAVDADLVVVGRQDRHSARALSNRLLPCALVNRAGPVLATPQRKDNARKLQVDWIEGASEPWVPELQHWLANKGTSLRSAQ
jgi:hypothetical protein